MAFYIARCASAVSEADIRDIDDGPSCTTGWTVPIRRHRKQDDGFEKAIAHFGSCRPFHL